MEVRPTDALANGLHLVQAYPHYSPGVGGWREDLSLAGNRLAGRGLGAAGEQADFSQNFFPFFQNIPSTFLLFSFFWS